MTGIKIFFLSLLCLYFSYSFNGNSFSQEVDTTKIIPELKNRIYSVQVKDTYAFAAVTAGLIIFDISDLSDVKEAGIAYTSGSAVSVTLSGNLAYLSVGSSGIWVFDISNPAVPKKVGHVETQGAAMATAVKGNTCYVADGTFGLIVLDVADPARPKEIFHHDIANSGDYYRHVAVEGDYVYAAVGFNGVKILKIEGNKVSAVAEFKTAGEARHVVQSGKHLFVADGQGGLRIYDISKIESPKELGSIGSKDFTRGVAVNGNLAYLADGNGGLRIMDISKPQMVAEKGFAKSPASANGIAVSGSIALIAADSAGLAVYDVSNPSSPLQVEKKSEKQQ